MRKAFERGRWWVGGLAALACSAGGAARAGEQARAADGFVDSMGINIHAAFPWSSYAQNWDGVIDAVGDIGFRHVRDIPYNPGNLNALSAATGAKVTVIFQHWIAFPQAVDLQNFDALWGTVKQLTHVEYIELPNEPETFESYIPPLAAKLHETVRADPVLKNTPLIGTTGYHYEPLVPTNPYLDYGNVHSYANGGVPTNRLDGVAARARLITGDKPIIATEAGYNNGYLNTANYNAPGVTEAATAKYLPRLYLDFYNAGIVKTFSYELVDSFADDTHTQQEGHFGLLRSDFSYKPAANAVKNLIHLLEDPGPAFTPASLEYTITGGSADLRHTLLQKRDGTFWLALWQDVLSYEPSTRTDLTIAPLNVSLELGIPAVKATTYRPNLSQSPTGTSFATDSLGLAVPDEVLLVALRLADPGDTDADGDVDNADFLTLYHNFGATGTDWAHGDFDRDGTVDFTDFQMLEAHFTGRLPPAEQAYYEALAHNVPEPGAASLLLAVASLAFTRRRRAR